MAAIGPTPTDGWRKPSECGHSAIVDRGAIGEVDFSYRSPRTANPEFFNTIAAYPPFGHARFRLIADVLPRRFSDRIRRERTFAMPVESSSPQSTSGRNRLPSNNHLRNSSSACHTLLSALQGLLTPYRSSLVASQWLSCRQVPTMIESCATRRLSGSAVHNGGNRRAACDQSVGGAMGLLRDDTAAHDRRCQTNTPCDPTTCAPTRTRPV